MAGRPNRKFRKTNDDYMPEGDINILAMNVEDAGFTSETLERLKSVELNTICDIAKCQMRHLYRIPNMGKKHIFEVLRKLQSYKLDFRRPVKKDITEEQDKTEKNAVPNKPKKEKPEKKIIPVKNPIIKEKQKLLPKHENETNNAKTEKNKNRINIEPQITIREKVNSRDLNAGRNKNNRQEKIKSKKVIVLPPLKNKDGLYKFYKHGKWGYKNEDGKIIIEPAYDEAFNFKEGMACVELKEKVGFINTKGELVIPVIYDTASSFSEGLASVTLDDKCGYIDKEGNVVIELKYEGATSFENGIALVKEDGKWGYYSRESGEIRLR